jgi:hypothetical protein
MKLPGVPYPILDEKASCIIKEIYSPKGRDSDIWITCNVSNNEEYYNTSLYKLIKK